MEPFLFYPVKNPINPTNPFGEKSPMYTALGLLGHEGEDFECPIGTPVYAPCDGDAFYLSDKDGGCGLWIRTPDNNPNDVKFNIILWHMVPKDTPGFPYSVATDGSMTAVTAGQLLGYSGNTGYPLESSGPHLHCGVMPCDKTGEALEPSNGYHGCVSPDQYWTGHYAQDVPAVEKVVAATQTVVQNIAASPAATPVQKLDWLQELVIAIEKLW
jgi:murein DD-endopeptidase MepM/ murein hydrolase activator NlpD